MRIVPDAGAPYHRLGGREAVAWVDPGTWFEVDSEDAFGGRLTSPEGRPREVAPYPHVNPLTGPVGIRHARPGDTLAVHVGAVAPLRGWGVSTVSPDFGLLSGTPSAPNLQQPADEHVFVWTVEQDRSTLRTRTPWGRELVVPCRPFLGTLGVAPAHGEVRSSVVPGAFGGNLDAPQLAAGTTLYLEVNETGALLQVGDGHLAQGDGEFAGTAVEAAVRSRLSTAVLPPSGLGQWPRLETDDALAVVGCGRPLEEAFATAVHLLSRWVAELASLDVVEAYELVSQTASARVANLVNPQYTAVVSIAKDLLPLHGPSESVHAGFRRST